MEERGIAVDTSINEGRRQLPVITLHGLSKKYSLNYIGFVQRRENYNSLQKFISEAVKQWIISLCTSIHVVTWL